MSLWNRLRVMAVLFAITILVAGLLDAFFSTGYEIVRSPIYVIILLVAFWFAAPWVAKYTRVGKQS